LVEKSAEEIAAQRAEELAAAWEVLNEQEIS
jgi:hypothetical protein